MTRDVSKIPEIFPLKIIRKERGFFLKDLFDLLRNKGQIQKADNQYLRLDCRVNKDINSGYVTQKRISVKIRPLYLLSFLV